MLKIINRNCAEIDVHKTVIVVTIAKTDEHVVTDYQHYICMESTGKYWIPVFNILEEQVLKLAINYSTELNLLLTIPGIKEISAIFKNLMNKNFKSHKNIQNTKEEMISYLTNLGYNITLKNT